MTHTFIVRIWLEPREIKGHKPGLRGSIEHIDTGQLYYFKTLSELNLHIIPYLDEMNIGAEKHLRFLYWIKTVQKKIRPER